ncbi:MAG: hypothetical protein Q9176_002913 [Flavoplaca citrina]
MSFSFLCLPREIRDQIYKLVLVHHSPLNTWRNSSRRLGLTPGLLRTNKIVLSEASSLLYAQNRFDLAMPSDAVASFFRQIGENNGNPIRHIRIRFPEFPDIDHGDLTLDNESVGILNSIQSSCPNLSTLTTCRPSSEIIEFVFAVLGDPWVTTAALKMVNKFFRAIPPVREIIIEVYEDNLDDFIRMEMKSLGWKIVAKYKKRYRGS